MLNGVELGKALVRAMELKGVKNADVAREFSIKPPSVVDWRQHGRIGKRHLDHLVAYFADVVGPEHWGISTEYGAKTNTSPAHRRLMAAAMAAADAPVAVLNSAAEILEAATAPPKLNERQRVLADLYRESVVAGDKSAAATLQRLLEAEAKPRRQGAGTKAKEMRSASR